jgi:hypothetical protein
MNMRAVPSGLCFAIAARMFVIVDPPFVRVRQMFVTVGPCFAIVAPDSVTLGRSFAMVAIVLITAVAVLLTGIAATVI